MSTHNGLARVNLGCGLLTPSGWINVDGSWNARLAKHPLLRRTLTALKLLPAEKLSIPWSASILVHDIRRSLPFANASVGAVYASHVLEHLYREEGQHLVRESFRVLAEGGVLRIVVPDLQAIVREYLGERPFGALAGEVERLSPGDRLNQRLLMRYPTPVYPYVLHRVYNSWKDLHSHKWMYDAESLAALVREAGFMEVCRREYRDSAIAGIEEVEEASRVLNGAGVCVEGVKPVSR